MDLSRPVIWVMTPTKRTPVSATLLKILVDTMPFDSLVLKTAFLISTKAVSPGPNGETTVTFE